MAGAKKKNYFGESFSRSLGQVSMHKKARQFVVNDRPLSVGTGTFVGVSTIGASWARLWSPVGGVSSPARDRHPTCEPEYAKCRPAISSSR